MAPPVLNWILLVQSSTARMPLLTTTNTLGSGRRRWSSPIYTVSGSNLGTIGEFFSFVDINFVQQQQRSSPRVSFIYGVHSWRRQLSAAGVTEVWLVWLLVGHVVVIPPRRPLSAADVTEVWLLWLLVGHVVPARQWHQVARQPQELQLRRRQSLRAQAHRLRSTVAACPQRPASRRRRLRLLPRSVPVSACSARSPVRAPGRNCNFCPLPPPANIRYGP